MKTRSIVAGLLFALAFAGGGLFVYLWLNQGGGTVERESQVLLERIKNVSKLVTTEGYFTEFYIHKDNKRGVRLYLPMPTDFKFTKKAIVKVTAKVSAGFDMEAMEIKADHQRKVIRISNIPDPSIISIDHDLEYFDMQESYFNAFNKEELTELNQEAKRHIEEKALESGLLESAIAQGNSMLEIIEFMVEEAGWTVEYDHSPNIEDIPVRDTL